MGPIGSSRNTELQANRFDASLMRTSPTLAPSLLVNLYGVHPSGCQSPANTLKRGHRTAALRFTALVVVQIWRSTLPNRITNHETPMNTDIQMPKPPISPTAPRSIFGLWISFVICHSTGPWSHCTLSKSPCIHKLSASERGVDAASLSLLPQLSLNSNLVGSFTPKRRYSAFAFGFGAIAS